MQNCWIWIDVETHAMACWSVHKYFKERISALKINKFIFEQASVVNNEILLKSIEQQHAPRPVHYQLKLLLPKHNQSTLPTNSAMRSDAVEKSPTNWHQKVVNFKQFDTNSQNFQFCLRIVTGWGKNLFQKSRHGKTVAKKKMKIQIKIFRTI